MKKHFFTLMVSGVLILGAMTGCNDKPETEPNPNPDGRVAITFEADITPPSILKVANDQWEASDKVGLYMKKAGSALTTAGAVYTDAANVQMSLSGQTLVSDPALFYPLEGNVDFVAYYPYTATVSTDYTIPVNVAEQATGLPVEVLYSNNAGNRAPTESAVPLNFRYSLAKLVVTVTGSTNSALTAADFAGMTVSVEGMYTQASLQLTNGTFTTHQGLRAINLHKAGNTSTSATFDALILPATVAPGEIVFVFNLGGNSYRCPVNGDYNAATQYRLAFNIDLPAPPERVATLLNAVIIPRTDENRDFTVDEMSPVTGVTLDPTTATMTPGDDLSLTATVLPGNAINKNVSWISSNTAVATVTNGLVTAVGPGTAVITATTQNGSFSATFIATVTSPVAESLLTMASAGVREVNFGFQGTGMMTIDWGDGSVIETHELSRNGDSFYSHTYSDESPHLITVKAADISSLECGNNQLTSLIVSENFHHLYYVNCSKNLLSADALNAFFESLPNMPQPYESGGWLFFTHIPILGNPGAQSCDIRIAMGKGYQVGLH